MAAEQTFRVLRTQAAFELGEAAGIFAAASTAHAMASQKLRDIETGNEVSAGEMRRLTSSGLINAATYEVVRRMVKDGQARHHVAAQALSQATAELDLARTELGMRRQREADLCRAIDGERRKKELARQVKEGLLVDDLWLQTNWSKA